MNRPPDVCALCDRPIDLARSGYAGLHLFLGKGWVHGGGREHIPVHYGCLTFAEIDRLFAVAPAHWSLALAEFRRAVGP